MLCVLYAFMLADSESNLQNKRLKLDYEEITPCLKEVTLVWEKMLGTPGRTKVKFETETIHAAVAQGTYLALQMHISVLEIFILFQNHQVFANIDQSLMYKSSKTKNMYCNFSPYH